MLAAKTVYRAWMSDPHKPLKDAFARYATGVTVVSCLPENGEPVGLTVNSFTSVSLDPPLVLWCLEGRSSLSEAFVQSKSYAVSILASDQQAFSNRFATPGHHGFKPEEAETYVTGCPLLKGRVAGFDCDIVERISAGDHTILIGQVRHFDCCEGAPLIYAGRQYLQGQVIPD